jgi:hypothetical protein
MSQIKTFVELNTAAVSHKEDRFYSAWLVTKYYLINEVGKDGLAQREILSVDEFLNICVKYLGIKKPAARKILKDGEGLFWHRFNDSLYIYGRKKLQERYNVKFLRTIKFIPLEDFKGTQKRRALLVATSLLNTPVSQIKIAKRHNVSTSSIKRYVKLANVKKTLNFGIVREVNSSYVLTQDELRQGLLKQRLGDDYFVVCRIANSYRDTNMSKTAQTSINERYENSFGRFLFSFTLNGRNFWNKARTLDEIISVSISNENGDDLYFDKGEWKVMPF